MPRSGNLLIPLRFERRSHWPRPASQPRLSLLYVLLYVLLFVGLAAVGAALGNSVAWTAVLGANPWQWRALASYFLPLLFLTLLLEWALLGLNRVGVRLALTAIAFATFLAVRTATANRAGAGSVDLALGIINPIAFFATIAAIFGMARWAGWRWVWEENEFGRIASRPRE